MALLMLLAFCLLFPLTILLIVPFAFALGSLNTLLTLPFQMIAVALDKERRRNHALEHATVNVLEERIGQRLPISGFAEADGFFVNGVAAQPAAIMAAAQEGLQRLQAGERSLAWHPRCGTVIVAGQLISALTFFAVLFYLKLSLPTLLVAMVVALLLGRLLAQPLGLLLQRTLTTRTDVGNLHLDRIEQIMPESLVNVLLTRGQSALRFRLWTRQDGDEGGSGGPKRWTAY